MNHLHEYAEYGGFGEFYVLEIVAGKRGRMPRRGWHARRAGGSPTSVYQMYLPILKCGRNC